MLAIRPRAESRVAEHSVSCCSKNGSAEVQILFFSLLGGPVPSCAADWRLGRLRGERLLLRRDAQPLPVGFPASGGGRASGAQGLHSSGLGLSRLGPRGCVSASGGGLELALRIGGRDFKARSRAAFLSGRACACASCFGLMALDGHSRGILPAVWRGLSPCAPWLSMVRLSCLPTESGFYGLGGGGHSGLRDNRRRVLVGGQMVR